MAGLKRRLYGSPLLAPYRAWRTRTLATRRRDHPLGFSFAGTPAFFAPDWELRERTAVTAELDGAEVFVDVGANQGIYTCLAAARGLPVAAVEPEAGNLRFLLGNVAANGFAVEVFPVALGGAPGIATLFGDGDTASLLPGWSRTGLGFAQSVPVNTLDNLFAARWSGKRLFVKMDVEGFEWTVLQGAATLVARAGTSWLIETFPRNYDAERTVNTGFEQVFETMFAAGYAAVLVGTGAAVTIADVRGWLRDPAGLEGSGANFLFRRD